MVYIPEHGLIFSHELKMEIMIEPLSPHLSQTSPLSEDEKSAFLPV